MTRACGGCRRRGLLCRRARGLDDHQADRRRGPPARPRAGRELEAQLDPILRAEGLTRGTAGERLAELNKRPDQLFPNTDEGRAALIAELNRQIAEIEAQLPRAFATLPKAGSRRGACPS
jgi:hypothetical protein